MISPAKLACASRLDSRRNSLLQIRNRTNLDVGMNNWGVVRILLVVLALLLLERM